MSATDNPLLVNSDRSTFAAEEGPGSTIATLVPFSKRQEAISCVCPKYFRSIIVMSGVALGTGAARRQRIVKTESLISFLH
jgi:hypothetical protein